MAKKEITRESLYYILQVDDDIDDLRDDLSLFVLGDDLSAFLSEKEERISLSQQKKDFFLFVSAFYRQP